LQEAKVKIHTRMTRTASLLGALVVLAGCADQATAPTAPDIVKLVNAANGSIIKSSVVTTTTFCRGTDVCSTSTRNSVIAEKVGRTGLAMVGISADGEQKGELPPGAVKSLSVSGRTLYADVAKDANKLWHVELTRDANARGKISGMRLSLNGELLLVQNTKWKNVSGAWYHEHSDLTFYVKGHVGVHQEKSFSPTAVLPANPADHSPASLTLVNDHASSAQLSSGYADDGSCPEWVPICDWYQAGVNPIPILGGVVGAIGGAIQSVSNWLVGVEAGAASDPDVATLSETALLAIEAVASPSWFGVAAAVFSAEQGGWTGGLFEAAVGEIATFLADALMLMF
jgi:hypothetical protein